MPVRLFGPGQFTTTVAAGVEQRVPLEEDGRQWVQRVACLQRREVGATGCCRGCASCDAEAKRIDRQNQKVLATEGPVGSERT